MTRHLFDMMSEPGADDSADDADSITLTLAIHGEVGKSLKVSETGDDKKTVLLPNSEIKVSITGRHTDTPGHPKYAIGDVTMPEWLAKDRGLI